MERSESTTSQGEAMHFGLRALFVIGIVVLTGCGGSDAPPSPPPPAPPPLPLPDSPSTIWPTGLTSIYGGTLTGSSAQDVIIAIDKGGGLWGIYGSGATSDFRPAGLISAYRPVTSTPTRYFSEEGGDRGARHASFHVTVDLAFDETIPSMSGKVLRGETVVFGASPPHTIVSDIASFGVTGGPMPGTGYEPNAQPTLEKIRGNWTLLPNEGSPISMNIEASGLITGTAGNCSVYASQIRPGDSGKNYYDVTLQFRRNGSYSCDEPYAFADGVRGFALAYPVVGGGMQMVIASLIGWDGQFFAAARKR